MNLVLHEVRQPSQWEDKYKGEMDDLVAAEASALEKTPAEVYDTLVRMACADDSSERVALLVDKTDYQLKGFFAITHIHDSLVINYVCKNKKVKTLDYMPLLKMYVNAVASEWGVAKVMCPLEPQIFQHCFKKGFLRNDPVSRKMKHLGLEPRYMIYEGTIGVGDE